MHRCSRRFAFVLSGLASLALLAASARASVIVVDLRGGGEFTSLPLALASAADGDTLVIRPGDYSGQATKLEINGRGLTLAADGTGPVITPPIQIANALLPKRFVLRGITAHSGNDFALGPGLSAISSDVFAEDCDFLGHPGGVFTGTVPGAPGVYVLFSNVVLKDCVSTGGKGFDPVPSQELASNGGPGVDVIIGRVSVYGGSLTGGNGGDIFGFAEGAGPGPNSGGPGLSVQASGSLVAGCTLTGGTGGSGDEMVHEAYKYKGGDGLTLLGANSLTLLDVTLVPGQGGFDGNGMQGAPGQPTQLHPGATLSTDPGPFRDYALGPPTPEGGSLQLSYAGVPGDLLAVFVTLQPAWVPLAAKQGVWHLGSPLFGPYFLAAPSGSLSLSLPILGVGLGPDGAVLLYEQAFVKPASGPTLLSSPTTHLIVDGSL